MPILDGYGCKYLTNAKSLQNKPILFRYFKFSFNYAFVYCTCYFNANHCECIINLRTTISIYFIKITLIICKQNCLSATNSTTQFKLLPYIKFVYRFSFIIIDTTKGRVLWYFVNDTSENIIWCCR